MTCPHCGASLIPGNRFCHKCRRRVSADAAGQSPRAAPPPRRPSAPPRAALQPAYDAGRSGPGGSAAAAFARPGIVTLLAVLNLLGGLVSVGLGAGMTFVMLASEPGAEGTGIAVALFTAYALLGVVQLATGVGLLQLRPWGRTLQIILAGIGLLGIPCGTLISVLILVYMLKPEVKTLFSGVSPRRLPPHEVARVEALSHGSSAAVVIAGVVVLFAAVAFVGIVAAIAIPSLLRARVAANESATIGNLRTVVSAEAAYASANRGYGDEIVCLVDPVECIPGYPESAPRFLDEDFLREQRSGYEYVFVPGVYAPDEVVNDGQVSTSSLSSWTMVATPLEPSQSGVRGFCADMTGVICFTSDGSAPDVSRGECPVGNEDGPGGCTPFR